MRYSSMHSHRDDGNEERRAGIQATDALIDGSTKPDMPGGYLGLGGYYYKWAGEAMYESHHGKYQFWHSMTTGKEKTNGEVLNKIIGQAKTWWESGNDENLGQLAHMVEDSYAGSHTARDENGNILFFQNYNQQDPSKHGTADERPGSWARTPGALQATKAATGLFKLKKENASFDRVEQYLRNDVYIFTPGAKDNAPGGSLPEYSK